MKTVNLKSLKLELILAYLESGREGIKKLLDKHNQTQYLKRHRLYTQTLDVAEQNCKFWIKEK